MKKIISLFVFLFCSSYIFSAEPLARALYLTILKYNGREVLVRDEFPKLNKFAKDIIVIPNRTITMAMLPPVMQAFSTPTIRLRLQQSISRNRTRAAVLAPSYRVLCPAFPQDLSSLFVGPQRKAIFKEENDKKHNLWYDLNYKDYFTYILRSMYTFSNSSYRLELSGYSLNNWQELQVATTLQATDLKEDEGIQYLEQVKKAFSEGDYWNDKRPEISIPVVNVLMRDLRGGYEYIDSLIPDLENGKLISYMKSIEPVWARIDKSFPKKTWIKTHGLFPKGKRLFTNGGDAGVLVKVEGEPGTTAYLVGQALEKNYKFYLQPIGIPTPITKEQTSYLDVNGLYDYYILYAAPKYGGPLLNLSKLPETAIYKPDPIIRTDN